MKADLAAQIRAVLAQHGRVPLDELTRTVADLVGNPLPVLIPAGWVRLEEIGDTFRAVEWARIPPPPEVGVEWVQVYRARHEGEGDR